MITQLTDLFPLIGISLALALSLSPIAIILAKRIELIDVPGTAQHKRHIKPTPIAGGLVLIFGIGLTYLTIRPTISSQVWGILLSSSIVIAWGLVDDKYELTPVSKLFGQLIASIILIIMGTQIQVTRINWLDLFLTVAWMVGLANAFNFVDSKDGLAIGIGGVASAFFMMVTIDSLQSELAQLSAVVLGACIGIFFYNSSPARMFLGDSGAQSIGFLLAAIGIAYVPANAGLPQAVSWFVPILVLGVPIFDTVLVVQSRLRKGQPIYQAGMDHLYHRLVQIGLASSRAVVTMHIISILLGLVAFTALRLSILGANLLFLAVIVIGLLGIVFVEKFRMDISRIQR